MARSQTIMFLSTWFDKWRRNYELNVINFAFLDSDGRFIMIEIAKLISTI